MPSHNRETLQKLYIEQLKDLYSAEHQILEALPKMIQKATHSDLKRGFQLHYQQTEQQVQRLEELSEMIGESLAGHECKGMKGLIKEGGTGRRAAVQKLIEGVGGKMEAFYFAYGDADAFLIVDVPDAVDGLALSMAVNASGVVNLTTIPLITPEEMDAACKKTVTYRAPGA